MWVHFGLEVFFSSVPQTRIWGDIPRVTWMWIVLRESVSVSSSSSCSLSWNWSPLLGCYHWGSYFPPPLAQCWLEQRAETVKPHGAGCSESNFRIQRRKEELLTSSEWGWETGKHKNAWVRELCHPGLLWKRGRALHLRLWGLAQLDVVATWKFFS